MPAIPSTPKILAAGGTREQGAADALLEATEGNQHCVREQQQFHARQTGGRQVHLDGAAQQTHTTEADGAEGGVQQHYHSAVLLHRICRGVAALPDVREGRDWTAAVGCVRATAAEGSA